MADLVSHKDTTIVVLFHATPAVALPWYCIVEYPGGSYYTKRCKTRGGAIETAIGWVDIQELGG